MNRNYDIDKLFLGNWHIHSNYSNCAKEEMTIENIISTAEKQNLTTIAITDHHHTYNEKILNNIEKIRDIVKTVKPTLKVLAGAELSAYGIGKFSDPLEMNARIEYRLYATNHYHLDFWEQPTEITPRAYIVHNYEIIKSLIISNRAHCIAHPFYFRYVSDKFSDVTTITKAMTNDELKEICKLSVEHNVIWEISEPMVDLDPEFVKRLWAIGKACGAKFNFGTDAHEISAISTDNFKNKFSKLL